MKLSQGMLPVIVGAVWLAGCASLPQDRGYAESSALVRRRVDAAPEWPKDPSTAVAPAAEPSVPQEPLSVEQAVKLAFANNPGIREAYARVGISRADLENARRIGNPTFGYASLDLKDGDGRQITRTYTLGFTDLLLLSARKQFAGAELERVQQAVASDLLRLAADVEVAWYEAVGARQVAAMREAVARSADASADLAQRFFDAGNINRLQLERERAAAAEARIEAVRAEVRSLEARARLANLIGLSTSADWRTLDRLPAPLRPTGANADELVKVALDQRLDLAAARRAVSVREDALGVTKRWRWLGSVEIGYENESEVDGGSIRGPTLSLELPIFNQGQGAVEKARSELIASRARLDALALEVHNEARLGLDRLGLAWQVSERYRTALVPSREAIVARSQEQVNFMLLGIFDLIYAKQQEYDAYQGYLESVRDYWTSRSELRRIVGGRLPGDDQTPAETVGIDAVVSEPDDSDSPDEHDHGATP